MTSAKGGPAPVRYYIRQLHQFYPLDVAIRLCEKRGDLLCSCGACRRIVALRADILGDFELNTNIYSEISEITKMYRGRYGFEERSVAAVDRKHPTAGSPAVRKPPLPFGSRSPRNPVPPDAWRAWPEPCREPGGPKSSGRPGSNRPVPRSVSLPPRSEATPGLHPCCSFSLVACRVSPSLSTPL